MCYVTSAPARDRYGCRRGANLPDYLLAIDQGTTSTRAILFDAALTPVATAQQEFAQLYPAPGLVEHDPEAIWSTTLATARAALDQAGASAREVAALGITNQRETALIWDRATGRPIHNAIVWQDRRTAELCTRLRREGHERMVAAPTRLVLGPPFLSTTICWTFSPMGRPPGAAHSRRP